MLSWDTSAVASFSFWQVAVRRVLAACLRERTQWRSTKLSLDAVAVFFSDKSKNSDQQACKKSGNEGGNSSSSACVERDMKQLDSGAAEKEGQRRLAVRFCDGSSASVVGTCGAQQQEKQDCPYIEGILLEEEITGSSRPCSL